MTQEKTLKEFGRNIQRLINKKDLTLEETYRMFCAVLRNEQPDLQQGAFLAALVSKGETQDEIVGAWQAIQEVDTITAKVDAPGPVVENSGTGMDSLKTFNVSSASAIVAAACGVTIARHGARALTSFCGTVDILESIGVDVECDVQLVEKSIRQTGIGLFNGMSAKVHPGGLGRILSQIRFGSTLNIAASLANPAQPTHGVRGVYCDSLVEPVGNIMAAIGYKRGMVVYGRADGYEGGMDELSICGMSTIHEFSEDTGSRFYILRPEEVGLKTVPFDEIAPTNDLKTERLRFLRVLAGQGHQGCIDFTCLNAGAVLYIGEQAASIEEGVQMACKAITSGAALEKLKSWISVQSADSVESLARLDSALQAV
ncbi:MAG: anthranilate phosphoribosyltransferase [Candidatus Electrothrix sp. AR3]|nr:anthranilate phosphoribosyltransferase [Candidatus Electrothrix sp. AR3]